MKIDKLKCLIVLGILVFLLGLYFYVTTSFRSTTQYVIKNQEQTTKDAQPSEFDTAAAFPRRSVPVFLESSENEVVEDATALPSQAELDSSVREDLSQSEIEYLIEEMEAERTSLHTLKAETVKLREELSHLLHGTLHDSFVEEHNGNFAKRRTLRKRIEQELLNGASLDETFESATPQEREDLRNQVESQPLIKTLIKHEIEREDM